MHIQAKLGQENRSRGQENNTLYIRLHICIYTAINADGDPTLTIEAL